MERSPDSEDSLLDTDEALERSREVLGSPLNDKSIENKNIYKKKAENKFNLFY